MATTAKPTRVATLPLVEGDRVDQPEFHRRYEAMPPGIRAELIDGVVYMPSPMGVEHGESSGDVVTWLGVYRARTPGVQMLGGATTILGRKSEPQPDVSLRIRPEYGGRTQTKRGFVQGAPELVVEVAKATRYIDLGPKRNDYERAGVQEYIVPAHEPDDVVWYVMRRRRLVKLLAGAEGLYRSEVFPGLWLDPQALLANDLAGMLAVLDQGLATPEHAAFVARLAKARGNT